MTATELKSFIHETVDNIDDEKFLEALKVIIETKFIAFPVLAEWQINAIEESERQIEAGEFISREEADKKVEEWLKSKNG
jgi:predicted transcriptional regulator